MSALARSYHMETLGVFAFEITIFVLKLGLVIMMIAAVVKLISSAFNHEQESGALKVTHLNEKLKRQSNDLKLMLLSPPAREIARKADSKEQRGEEKREKKEAKKEAKKERRQAKRNSVEGSVQLEKSETESQEKSRLFVLTFKGDIQASAVESLREEITSIIQIGQPGDEVLVKLNNSGGYVHTHGLAASQLNRLKAAGYSLTVAIDQIAASGGYMMACVGDKIIAAPFAIIGSIGVVAQVPNVHRFLKKHDVDVELHTAGEYKRTLTILGENTDEGRAKFIKDLHKTHDLFKDFVTGQREQLDVAKVATGETWYGVSALEAGLIDEIKTSDEVILQSLNRFEVYELSYERKRKVSERALSLAHHLLSGRLPEV